MKTGILFILACLIISAGCKKEAEPDTFKDLKGAWYNNTTDFDLLIFENDSTVLRKNLLSGITYHHYSVEIYPDVIIIRYTGLDKIDVPASTKKYSLNKAKDQLYIEEMDQYYPYFEGNQFTRIKDY